MVLDGPCVIVSDLQDQEVMEEDVVKLAVTISKPRQVSWFKGSARLSNGDRWKIRSKENGTIHTLTIKEATLKDGDEYMASIDDNNYGTISTKASVNVKGTKFFICMNMMTLHIMISALLFFVISWMGVQGASLVWALMQKRVSHQSITSDTQKYFLYR